MTGEEDPLTYLQRPLFERASEDVVEALLQHGADPNATTTKPHPLPPLLMATKLHLTAGVIASLLRHGARPDVGVAWSTSKISTCEACFGLASLSFRKTRARPMHRWCTTHGRVSAILLGTGLDGETRHRHMSI